MEALLTVLATWLTINFGLPAMREVPRVEFASPAKMAQVRHKRVAKRGSDSQFREPGQSLSIGAGRDVHAIYDDASRTIYLPDGWTGVSPAQVSVLVHELVHHVQNMNRITYNCAGAREKPAYQAQARWLELFGKSLQDEFGIDAMTLLVRTNCMG